MYDWDTRSEMPETARDEALYPQPRLQEYDWARERSERRVSIAIVNTILTELAD